jgi:proline racemase
MKARRVVVGVGAAVGLFAAGVMPAAANIAWCVDDPPVQVESPSGANLTVNTTIVAPKDQSSYVSMVVINATTVPDGAGGTLVTVTAALPAGMSSATVVAQVKRYHVGAIGSGVGGDTVTLYLDVPTS